VEPAPAARAAPAGFAPGALTPQGVLFLQRSGGNAAVGRFLRGANPGSPPHPGAGGHLLARYEAGEHAAFGGGGTVNINGVAIPRANVIAMGDFYGSPEAMQSADPAELRKLNALIERDKDFRAGKPGVKEPSNDEIEEATSARPEGQRFMDLNKTNQSHFAPPKDEAARKKSEAEGKDHKSAFAKHHKAALDQATEGGASPASPSAPKRPAPDKARATNGFANHYLTDAFSAGHLINKDEVMQLAKKNWEASKDSGFWANRNAFTDAVAAGVLADPKIAELMAGKEMSIHIGWTAVTPARFSELMHTIAYFKTDDFLNLFARIVHDKLNEQGVEVEVQGKIIKLAGDETLKGSPDSLAAGRAAVAQSDANVEEAANSTTAVDPEAMVKKVWDMVPKPTKSGQQQIDQVTKELTDMSDPKSVAAIVELSKKQMPTLVKELTKENHLRDKRKPAAIKQAPAPPPAPPPAPAPTAHAPAPPSAGTPAAPAPAPSGTPEQDPLDAGVPLPGGVR
jgi:hypothetical protein